MEFSGRILERFLWLSWPGFFANPKQNVLEMSSENSQLHSVRILNSIVTESWAAFSENFRQYPNMSRNLYKKKNVQNSIRFFCRISWQSWEPFCQHLEKKNIRFLTKIYEQDSENPEPEYVRILNKISVRSPNSIMVLWYNPEQGSIRIISRIL